MKRALISLCSTLTLFFFQVQSGFCWGSAVHAYIADHLGKKAPLLNLNEVYGAMAPDVFNYMFDNPALQQTLVMGTRLSIHASLGCCQAPYRQGSCIWLCRPQ